MLKWNAGAATGLLFVGLTLFVSFAMTAVASAQTKSSRKARIRQSPNYREGAFQNLEVTPALAEGYSMPKILFQALFRKSPNTKPSGIIPSIKTNLHTLPPDSNVLIRFGHSSYFMQVGGLKILVDPVLSGHAAPVSFMVRAFNGANTYSVADLPKVDYLLISHDHYDHLDKKTVKALQPNVGQVICGLGVGAILERWGYTGSQVIEADWNETIPLRDGSTLHTVPARHFSGRGLRRNQTLWLSYLLQTGAGKFFLGGDSGYGTHFAQIGAQYGPIDLAILENGQYNKAWHYIHCLPEETLQAARDLGARNLMPVHNSKFSLALHSWNEPMDSLTKLNASGNALHLVRPRIGEPVLLTDSTKEWSPWWD
jgi:L-ascorbate metabolism protein UlaG (beta-lactamase superfamily)